MITEITNPTEKQSTARKVLEALTDWFGIEESREDYITRSADWTFLVARDDNNDIIISNEGLYFYLAKIYFITYEDKKLYMLEKLPNNLKPNIEEVKIIAQQLEKQNIFVDIQSAVLIDEETKQYKFRKYKILKG